MIWRNPVAWFGLATLLIPVAIHLLVRHRAEPRLFPSLRFVQPTRLASVRRKMISDWPLLLVRLAMLAAAVAALADPLWQSAARRAEWNARQARAIVVDTTPSVSDGAGAAGGAGDIARSLVQREAESAFRAETFGTKDVADGVRRAAAWLRTAPPSRRELVVISDFQLGAFDAAMLRDIPSHVGIRLVRTSAPPVTRTADGQPRTQRGGTAAGARAGAFTMRTPRVTLNANETAVTWTDAASASAAVEIDAADEAITLRPFDLKLRGSTTDRPFLLAAAEAVLAQGVPLAAVVGGVRNSATIIISTAAPGPPDASARMTTWQVNAARAIATDASLARAAGRATVDSAQMATNTTAPVGHVSEPQSSEATAKSRTASNGSSEATGPWTAVMRSIGVQPTVIAAAKGSLTDQTGTASPETSASPSSEATAKSRRASNASGDAPEPWIVLMRDSNGATAILAAADGAKGEARLLVWSRVAAADEATALLIRATLRALAGPDAFGEAEVIAMPDATLARWQRPAAEPPASEWRDVEGNDRRWLWGAVIVLLVVEQVVRRRARHADAQTDRKVYENAA